MNKIIYVILGLFTITFLLFFSSRPENNQNSGEGQNVTIANGQQIIQITAKGGYFPQKTIAKADTPTVLQVKTTGTFDCSSALAIPSLKYSKNLPLTGNTEIPIPPQKSGSKIQGLCSMGMYNFTIEFS